MSVEVIEKSPYQVTLEVFEGPLDMLLHLIRENQIDIYDIPIVRITEQYIKYLELMESLNLEIAGEWLVMAATLIEIKSRMLLPKEKHQDNDVSEEDPRIELVERLIEYERIKSAAEIFREKEIERSKVFARGGSEADFNLQPKFVLEDISATDLLNVLQSILCDMGDEEVTTLQKRKITIRIRIREIWNRLQKAGKLVFNDLFDDAQNRVEIVITFLALLELIKMRKIVAKQKNTFAPIHIIALAGTDET